MDPTPNASQIARPILIANIFSSNSLESKGTLKVTYGNFVTIVNALNKLKEYIAYAQQCSCIRV